MRHPDDSLATFVVALVAGLAAPAPPAAAQCPASQTRYSVIDIGTLGDGLTPHGLPK